MKIFYSWQSDKHIPNNLNRSFIEKALENATKAIRNDESIEVVPVIDRDTFGVSGTPSIPQTILQKIDESDVFVCDITIVNSSKKFRPTPNPNVLFELGYAVHKLGWEKIVMIMNEAFGDVSKLPFDLEKRRVLLYTLTDNQSDKPSIRLNLERRIESLLKLVAENNKTLIETDFKLTPIFDFQCSRSPNVFDDQCSLKLRLKNEGRKTIKDFRVDILFPNEFLNQHTLYGLEVESKKTESQRLFRILPSYNRNQPLYPGDEIMQMLSYQVSDKQKASEAIKQKIYIDIFVEDNHLLSLEKEISEFVNLPSNLSISKIKI